MLGFSLRMFCPLFVGRPLLPGSGCRICGAQTAQTPQTQKGGGWGERGWATYILVSVIVVIAVVASSKLEPPDIVDDLVTLMKKKLLR